MIKFKQIYWNQLPDALIVLLPTIILILIIIYFIKKSKESPEKVKEFNKILREKFSKFKNKQEILFFLLFIGIGALIIAFLYPNKPIGSGLFPLIEMGLGILMMACSLGFSTILSEFIINLYLINTNRNQFKKFKISEVCVDWSNSTTRLYSIMTTIFFILLIYFIIKFKFL